MNQLNGVISQYGAYLFIFIFVLIAGLVFWIYVLWARIKKIFKGESNDLEKVMLEIRKHEDDADEFLKKLDKRVSGLELELPKDIRKVGLVRYNPFSDAGGDQSFALALLNEENDGVILSSLYGREINRVYAKPIEKGNSTYQLTIEEKTAIQNAK